MTTKRKKERKREKKRFFSDEDKCSGGRERAQSLIVTRDYAVLYIHYELHSIPPLVIRSQARTEKSYRSTMLKLFLTAQLVKLSVCLTE